ncbi:MAG: hypothetical protein K0S54_2046 [Alphaproteobacteria bacterium]|jgi:hypothetical protein|nr:hypothetical protein [Alphaproteobacteria bacterium]
MKAMTANLSTIGDAMTQIRSLTRGLLAGLCLALAIGLGTGGASAQQAAPKPATAPATAQVQTFPTPQAAFDAFVAALKSDDEAAKRRLFGADFRKVVPSDVGDMAELRQQFLTLHAAGNKVLVKDDKEAVLEVGTAGWTFPIPVVKTAAGWGFDVPEGLERVRERVIGRNELSTIQTLLAVADAQGDYAQMDPMKTGSTQYARRIMSSPGKKDGLYWESKPGEPESPLGEALAKAQSGGANSDVGYNGYKFRLLYSQGASAPGGAYDYLIRNRMMGGFAILAWPVKYGETGIMSFMVSHDGVVYEKDLGPNTATAAGTIQIFDPDKSWEKADATP